MEYLVSQLREIGFSMDLDNDVFKRYYYGDTIHSFVGYSTKYTLTITRTEVVDDSYMIELVENKPIIELSTNRVISLSGCSLYRFSITPLIVGNTLKQDKKRINNFLEYIYNIDIIKQSIRKNKLKRINGRLGIKV